MYWIRSIRLAPSHQINIITLSVIALAVILVPPYLVIFSETKEKVLLKESR